MLTHTLGFPRMGSRRELKTILEAYWKGTATLESLQADGRVLRRLHWQLQRRAGIDLVPVGDFSFYDHMLDMIAMVGAVPERFRREGEQADLDTRFFMARGVRGNASAPAMEMTKWFNTNYHYIVPEFFPKQQFRLSSSDLFDHLEEAIQAGFPAKPVLPGPFTFLALGKETVEGFDRWQHLDALVSVYEAILTRLATCCQWIQLDEPILASDLPRAARAEFTAVYKRLQNAANPARILVATYFGGLEENLELALDLPVAGLHVDMVSAPDQLPALLSQWPTSRYLSLGLVDGRNVWRTDLDQAREVAEYASQWIGEEQVMLGTSCSLLHVPVDLELEHELDPEIFNWLAFARQKCGELNLLRSALAGEPVAASFEENRQALAARAGSKRVRRQSVRHQMEALTPEISVRQETSDQRRLAQSERFNLPLLPTTTIGSFPQTPEIRAVRHRFRQGHITAEDYQQTIKEYICQVIDFQEESGLDVFVHGEFERTDMVEYFAEHLEGFCFTRHGWVQSYGSRCVKPPVLYGDVERPHPISVQWTQYAQSLTGKPVKGMLTGPVTLLNWSFVRDDQPRRETCLQLALAMRAEVLDLEEAGIGIIQVDEAALREGLPLRREQWRDSLSWAVDAFRLTTSGVRKHTQIHTHMCYSDFNHIVEWLAFMDADVISIEASRSHMELLQAFQNVRYPNDIGPGIWDIHSPRIPSVEEISSLLCRALQILPAERLWVNPDCGLKTRTWPEVRASIHNMVSAATAMRSALSPAMAASQS